MPTGPVIVLTGTAVVLAAIMLAPRRGVAWRLAARRAERRREAVSGLLVDLETMLHAGPPPTRRELVLATARPPRAVARGLRRLDAAGLLARDGERIRLSEAGAAAAHAALENRAMWGAWLEHGARLGLRDAREPDPRDLRGSLGEEAYRRLQGLAGAGGR